MRYFVITYLKKPTGKIDEATEITKRVRTRDIQCASVIMDFKEMKIIKASVNGSNIPPDWDTIHDYYIQHYENVFRRLHSENGRSIEIVKPETDPGLDTKTETAAN
jgi:hypothetical protein